MRGPGKVHGRIAVGHPIDVASGEFFANEVDHEVTGVVPLSLGRTYNTRFLVPAALTKLGQEAAADMPFGKGWRPSWLYELRATMSGFVYTTPDGTELQINDLDGSLATTGRLLSPEHALEVTRVDSGNVRIVGYGRDRDEHSLFFQRRNDGRYRLLAIERTREARIELLYDEATGLLSDLSQRRERRSYALEHTADGRISRVGLRLADGSLRQILGYAYDDQGQLLDVTDERGFAARYLYDDAGRMIHDEKRGGSVYTIRYDARGRSVYAAGTGRYEERSLRFDDDARKTFVQDSHGGVTVYEWNDAGQVVTTTSPCGEISRATFDQLGRLASETNANGVFSETIYDADGHVGEERVNGAATTRYTYDHAHRLVEIRELAPETGDVLSRTRLGYDEDHNVTLAQENEDPPWRYTFSPWGEVLTAQAPSGAASSHTYDDIGGLRNATNFDGRLWTWTCDLLGRVLTETDPLGHTWRVEYLDADGRSTRLTEPDGRVYTNLVSEDERVVLQTLPGDRTRHVELSFCGLLLSVTDEEGAVTRLTWGTEPGELSTIVNANGDDYRFGYDADLRLVSRRTFDGRLLRTRWKGERKAGTWDAAGRPTEYDYDARGLLVSQKNADGETKLEYDARGFVRRIESPTSALAFERDARGRVVAEVRDGIRVSRELDVMGLAVSQTSPRGHHASYAWTPTGFLDKLRYKDTEIAFDRDAVGREVRRHLGQAGVLEQSHDPVGRIVSQSFRPHLRDTASSGAQPSMLRHFGFDTRGFLASVEDSLRGPARLLHNERGDLTGVVRANGASDFYAFDPCRNRVFGVSTAFGPALATAMDRARTNRVQAGDLPMEIVSSNVPHTSTTFGHGPGDRLVVIGKLGSTIELRYDANGQVVEKTVVHDSDRQTWKYGWNAQGELVELTTPSGDTWTYRYDPAGRRVEKRGPARSLAHTVVGQTPSTKTDTWTFVWLGEELLETLKNDVLVETYVAEPDGTGAVLRDDGALHFILPDQIDSASEEVDANGTLEWFSRKGTWGETPDARGPTGAQPFVGQWLDVESGLHYNRFRYYDPDSGRYLSPDPIDLLGGPNAYSAITDPLSDYDPDGLVSPNAPNYGLYHIVDTANNDKVVYVGITDAGPNNDFSRRNGEHRRSGRLGKTDRYKLVPKEQGLTYAQARGYEQADIEHHKTLKTGRQGTNMRAGAGNRVRSYNPLRKTGKWRLRLFKKFEKERKEFHAETCGS